MHNSSTGRIGARTLAALVLVVGSVGGLLASPGYGRTVAEDAEQVRSIIFPIVGDHHYSDTFGACRSGCSRGHQGTDIIADRLTPLVAAADATVKLVKTEATPDGSSGNYVFLVDDAGWEYWYIHINNDSPGTDDGANPPDWVLAPGVEPGARVVAGQLVSWVGDSGNAEASVPHLHFEIHTPDGEVVNPYPSLQASTELDEPVGGAPEAPLTPEQAFVEALHRDFIGRKPTRVERTKQVERLEDRSLGDVLDDFVASDTWVEAIVDGYFFDTLGRLGDAGGSQYWADVIRGGRTAADVAAYFYASDEYHRRVGGTDRAWVFDLIETILGRTPDRAEVEEHLAVLAAGAERDVISFAVYQSVDARELRVDELYRSLLGRPAEPDGRAYWADVLADGRDLALATYLAASPEYWDRANSRADAGFDEVDASETDQADASEGDNGSGSSQPGHGAVRQR